MNILEQKLKEQFKNIVYKLYELELSIDDISLEVPPKKELGDFAFPCFWLSKALKKSPAQIWQEIIDFVKSNYDENTIITDLEIAWPYLNFKIEKKFLSKFFIETNQYILDTIEKSNNSSNIFVDYIWTNVWKPLHIGHICTPNVWQVIINVYKKLWYNVITDSHIWDWGIIFGKLISAFKLWWDEDKLKVNAVDYLLELYVKATEEAEKHSHLDEEFRKEFKELSIWNPESIELWKKFTRYSIDAMQIELDRLHVRPDFDIGESFYEWIGLPKMWNYPDLTYNMKDIVKELVEKWIATKNDDSSVWVSFFEESKIPSCILQKRDWTHGYLASDLAAVKYRMQNWRPSKILYFIDVRQQLHLKQVFEISRLAWWTVCHPELDSGSINCKNHFDDSGSSPEWHGVKTEFFHAYNWFISLKDWAMSSRKWNIIKLKDLLDEAEVRAKNIILEKRNDFSDEELNKLSKIIWIWAIKYWYLSKNRTLDVIFDWDEFMTFEGNSAPYIQYAYVRAKQILVNNEKWIVNIDKLEVSFDYDEEIDLVKELYNYKSIFPREGGWLDS